MTGQEQQMLQGLIDRVNRTQLADKDADAEQLIQQTLGSNPDALYVLAQTVLVQGYALQQAQKQVADLRVQLSQAQQHTAEAKHSGSFLGNLLGRHDEPQAATAPPPLPPMQPQYASAGYGPGLAYPSGGYPIAGGAVPQGGGFLRSAMQTATGVAAGALAFEGIESLMHGFGHAAGYGTEFGGMGSAASGVGGEPREEIVNNYYGDASAGDHKDGGMGDRAADSSQAGNVADTGDGGRLQDASYVTPGADQTGNDGETADDLSGTTDTDYSSQGDDSMLADNVGGDQGDSGGMDSGGDFGGDDSGGDFGGGDSSSF